MNDKPAILKFCLKCIFRDKITWYNEYCNKIKKVTSWFDCCENFKYNENYKEELCYLKKEEGK